MTATIQRPLKGSRIATFYPVKTLPSLSSLESAFQLQEYISLLIRLDVHDVEAITSLPGTAGSKEALLDKDTGANGEDKVVSVDQWCWIYEQLRRLAQDLTHPLITTLQQECTRATCPEMKAGEWLYLCVAHGNEGSMEQCCAIDYILHTLDSATALLNSPRAFPSRMSVPESSQRHFSSLSRRLGRIFAHAYFHHREAFEQAEAESSLYARFLALTSKFGLVPSEFLPIPPEAFYGNHDDQHDGLSTRNASPPRLLGAGLEPQPGGSEVDHNQRQQWQQAQLKSLLRHNEEPHSSLQHLEPPRNATGSPPGLVPEGSPRRSGRNRTDTMVFTEAEANTFAEQLLARSGGTPGDLSLADSENLEPEVEATELTETLIASTESEKVVEETAEEPAPVVVEPADLVDLTDVEATSATTVEEPEAPVASSEESKDVTEVPDPEPVVDEAPVKDERPATSESDKGIPEIPVDTVEASSEAIPAASADKEEPVAAVEDTATVSGSTEAASASEPDDAVVEAPAAVAEPDAPAPAPTPPVESATEAQVEEALEAEKVDPPPSTEKVEAEAKEASS